MGGIEGVAIDSHEVGWLFVVVWPRKVQEGFVVSKIKERQRTAAFFSNTFGLI